VEGEMRRGLKRTRKEHGGRRYRNGGIGEEAQPEGDMERVTKSN
jgi:hypothetical protein